MVQERSRQHTIIFHIYRFHPFTPFLHVRAVFSHQLSSVKMRPQRPDIIPVMRLRIQLIRAVCHLHGDESPVMMSAHRIQMFIQILKAVSPLHMSIRFPVIEMNMRQLISEHLKILFQRLSVVCDKL